MLAAGCDSDFSDAAMGYCRQLRPNLLSGIVKSFRRVFDDVPGLRRDAKEALKHRNPD
jgi:hypothetical protein